MMMPRYERYEMKGSSEAFIADLNTKFYEGA